MKTHQRAKALTLSNLTLAALLTMTLPACSKQNWYQGARSAQTAQCMQGPESEYKDCNQQSE
ncbi:MAG: hypothetical protein IMF14_08430, partial [Proteobacteria bacterium]|nr:hypothetical protein [Pseudomonadota bacterium]